MGIRKKLKDFRDWCPQPKKTVSSTDKKTALILIACTLIAITGIASIAVYCGTATVSFVNTRINSKVVFEGLIETNGTSIDVNGTNFVNGWVFYFTNSTSWTNNSINGTNWEWLTVIKSSSSCLLYQAK